MTDETASERLIVVTPNHLQVNGKRYRCTLGRAGISASKREGDGTTPAGEFLLRCCYYRPDRLAPPPTALPLVALSETDGWCDDPAHPAYNQPVKLPFGARHEALWRDDHCYDLIIPLGYNDEPVVPGRGSAIFMHVMHDDSRATEGCVALRRQDLLAILPNLSARTTLVIPPI